MAHSTETYSPDASFYGYQCPGFFTDDEVKEAQNYINTYRSAAAVSDFDRVKRAVNSRDPRSAERLMRDWCKCYEYLTHDGAEKLNQLRGRAMSCKGASIGDEYYTLRDRFESGAVAGSFLDMLHAAEKKQLRKLVDDLGKVIWFQVTVGEQINRAPWVAMSDEELNEMLDAWDAQTRRDKALDEIRAARDDQVSFVGRADWASRWPEVFGGANA